MNSPVLIKAVILFIAGISAGRLTDIPFLFFWVPSFLFLLLSAAFFKKEKFFLLSLGLSILFLGAAFLKNSETLTDNHISKIIPHKQAGVCVEGVVESDPIAKTRFTAFVLRTEKLTANKKRINACGKILVKDFKKRGFSYGDRLIIEGKIYRVPFYRVSRRLNYRDYLSNKGIYSILSAGKDSAAVLLKKNRGNPLKKLAYSIEDEMNDMVKNNMNGSSGSILSAVVLGERGGLSRALRNALIRTGTMHIISISGLHAGLVSLIVLTVLKVLRIPKKLCCIISAFAVFMYCLLTGAQTPVVRVTIMTLVLYFGYMINRAASIYNMLSLSAFIILLYNPRDLFDISFQLSFGSILSLALFFPAILNFFPKEGFFAQKFRRYIVCIFCGSLAAEIGLFPLVAYYFNIISPIALFANMFVIPYFTVIVGFGAISIISGLFHTPFTAVFFEATGGAIEFLVRFISLSARVPGAYFYISDFPFFAVLLYYILLAAAVLLAKEQK